MGAYEPDEQHEQHEQHDPDRVHRVHGPRGPVWVEELVGPDDYWLTLTDAARVTRRQEVTIRRWVASGTLPIRNRPLGINKRTRHVRASDLARLSPIVDASATISGAAAQIDLLSIPEQQGQILERQHEIDQQVQSLTTQVEQVGHAGGAQQTMLDQQQARLAAVEGATEALRSELTTGAQLAEKRQGVLGRQLSTLQQNVRQLGKDTKELQDEQEAVRSTQESVAKRQNEQEMEQREYLARLQQVDKRQSKDARDRGNLQRRLEELEEIARRANALEPRLQLVEKGLVQLREELHQQEGEFTRQLSALQQHLREVDDRSQAAVKLLAQEHERVQQLAGQVSTLAEHTYPAPVPGGEPASKPVRRRRGKRPPTASRG
jgi:chromosome segregation ATPase